MKLTQILQPGCLKVPVDGRDKESVITELVDLLDALDAAADGERDEHFLSNLLNEFHHGLSRTDGGRDVQEDQFVGPGVAVAGTEFHRVAGITQVQKVDALDDAIVFDIETRNDSLGQHVVAFRAQMS